jgi:immune inhibitor A
MLILHIDDNQNNNRDETHKWVDVEEADGNTELDDRTNRGRDEDLFYNGNNTSFTPTSTPNSNTYDNGASGISITNISNRGNIMTCDVQKN